MPSRLGHLEGCNCAICSFERIPYPSERIPGNTINPNPPLEKAKPITPMATQLQEIKQYLIELTYDIKHIKADIERLQSK